MDAAPLPQLRYSRDDIWQQLCEYQVMARGGRRPRREERLGSKPAPLDEAAWCWESSERADLAAAIKALPEEYWVITFMTVCVGYSQFHTGTMADWKARVARWWSIEVRDVNAIVQRSVDILFERMNGMVREA